MRRKPWLRSGSPFSTCPRRPTSTFPWGDARFESQFIPHITLIPIPSLWGHPAGAGASPADKTFLNKDIAAFLAGEPLAGEPVASAK